MKYQESKECEMDVPSFEIKGKSSWESTKSQMNNLLTKLESSTDHDIALIQSIVVKLHDLDCRPKLNQTAEDILSEIDSKIAECKSQFSNEEKALHTQMSRVSELESHAEELSSQLRDLKAEEADLKSKIKLYNRQAEEQVEEIDNVEYEQIEQVTRLQGTVTLMATASGIKWHYDDENAHLIKGEIDVPSRRVTRKFCFQEDEDGLEVTDALWDMMMGE